MPLSGGERPIATSVSAEPPPNRTEQAFAGWLWLSSGAVVQGLVTVGSLAVLARLLSPADFGAVSAGMLVVNLVSIVSQGLVGPALVQHPRLRLEHVHTGFAISLLGGAVLFGALWVVAPAVGLVLHFAGLVAVLRALAWMLPLQSLGAVADALLRRDLEYGPLARIRMVSYAIGYGAIGVTVAVLGGGLWALVAANLGQVSLNTILLLKRKRHSKLIRISRRELGELVSFAGGFCLGKVGNYAATEGDYLVTVKWLGLTALGLYERAYQLMAMPAILVGQVLDDVLFPAMAQIQTQRDSIANAYRRCVAAVALFALPLSALVLILAPEIVNVLLGPKWDQVVPPFRVLALGTLFRTSYKISDSLTRALGAVYQRAWRQWTYAGLVVGGGIIGQQWGLQGVAAAVLLALIVNFLLTAHLATRLVSLSWADYFRAHVAGARAAALVAFPGLVIATVTRTVLGLPSAGVLLVTLVGTGLVVAALLTANPPWLLGADGQYLVREGAAFVRRRVGRSGPPVRGVI